MASQKHHDALPRPDDIDAKAKALRAAEDYRLSEARTSLLLLLLLLYCLAVLVQGWLASAIAG
jgi:hypothetical protein